MSNYQARLQRPENTFVVVLLSTGKAVAEVSDALSLKINAAKYTCLRPSVYLPTLNRPA